MSEFQFKETQAIDYPTNDLNPCTVVRWSHHNGVTRTASGTTDDGPAVIVSRRCDDYGGWYWDDSSHHDTRMVGQIEFCKEIRVKGLQITSGPDWGG